MHPLISLLFIFLLLSGCGGDGNDSVPSNTALTASFSVSASSGEIPFTVTIDASTSQSAKYFQWDFGDGTSAEGTEAEGSSIISHTYTERGLYTIQLTTSDQEITTSDDSQEDINQQTSALIVRAIGHTLAGTITAPNTSFSDADTNDPNVNISNNSFADAQLIPALSVTGGHLNVTSDPSDFYRVDLTGGQLIQLFISQHGSDPVNDPDLDLYLYNETQILIDASLSISDIESLIAPEDGSYFLEIRAITGESNYLLGLTDNAQNASSSQHQNAFRLSSNFVNGEAIIQAKEDQESTAKTSALSNSSSEPAKPKLLKQSHTEQENPLTTEEADSAFVASINDQELIKKLNTLTWIKNLNKSNQYAYVEPNSYRAASAAPNDQFFPLQWHYNNIQLSDALDIEGGNSSVIVAVLDTGVLASHPDLSSQLISGYDFISDTDLSLDGNGIDSDPNDPGDQSHTPNSSSFHGTHVIGTVAATTNNSIGVAGTAGGTRVMPLRVLGKNGFGTNYDIIQALRYAAGLSNDSGTIPPQAASIINLSLGSSSFSQSEQDLYNTLANMGILVVAAAGNSNSSSPDYPASYNNVISVSATNISNTKAQYSNFGSRIDLAAPGGDLKTDLNGDGYFDGVLSTMGDDSASAIQFTYGFAEGTSMAAPHVAGVVALMKSINPDLTTNQFNTLMESGLLSDDLGETGRDDLYGHGLINARKAVEAASGSATATANILLSTNSLNFGSFSNSETITVSDSSNNTLTINNITVSNDWVSVAPVNTNPQGFGSYRINIDRSRLSDGNYNEQVTFNTESLSRTLSLFFQVITTPISSDAGYLYVLAIDPNDNSTQGFSELGVNNGEYQYEITDLNKGSYLVVAGTDMNADFFICDTGDSCGAYPTLNAQEAVNLQESTRDINFTVRFDNQVNNSNTTSTKQSEPIKSGLKTPHLGM